MVIKKEVTLNFASLKGNNNKFYRVILEETGGAHGVIAYYGRMGATPTRISKHYLDFASAEKEFNARIRSKEKKGYKQIELVSSNEVLKEEIKVKETTGDKKVTSSQAKVFELIGNLLGEAKDYVKSNVNLPLGKLSENQILKGRNLLDEIEKAIHTNTFTKDEAIAWSDSFYEILPVIFNKMSTEALIINTFDKVNKNREILDVMSSVVATGALSKVEDAYNQLGLTIKALTPRAKAYQEIETYVLNTQSSNHRFRLKVKNIFEINKKEWKTAFNPKKLETTYLFHGSRTENYLKILQSGLKIKPKGAVHTGSMFGNGIYFADQSSKSANYCWGFNRQQQKGKSFYMLVCDVAAGKMKNYENAQSSLNSPPQGYDSVRGIKGRSLVHNEIIVYEENQSNIRYMVEFTEI